MSAPPGVDEMLVSRNQPRIVRGKEQHHRRHVIRPEPALQALRVYDLRLSFRSVPLELSRRPDIARNDAGDADIVLSKVARHRSRQSFDGRLASLVENEARKGEVPTNRAEVDDHPGAVPAHAGDHGL